MTQHLILLRRSAFFALAFCTLNFIFPKETFSQPIKPFCEFSPQKGWKSQPKNEYITHRASRNDKSGVPEVINKIYQSLSINPEIDIFLAENENNAFATVAGGRKIIVVDVNFISSVNRISKTKWAAIQVIAHELGHHIAGFSNNRHKAELNADYWSGQALQRLGASRAATIKAIMVVGAEQDTDTHPNKHRRAATIEQGWDDAFTNKINYAFCDYQCN